MARGRLFSLVAGLSLVAGCSGGYAAAGFSDGGRIYVSSAPPPLEPEVHKACSANQGWTPGQWDWNGSDWSWTGGRCVRVEPGSVWVPPYYAGGVYYKGYWAQSRYYARQDSAQQQASVVTPRTDGALPPAPVVSPRTDYASPAPPDRPPTPRDAEPAPVYTPPTTQR